MEEQYLIDTNSVIDFLGGRLPVEGSAFMNAVIDKVPTISVITKIEVLGFNTNPSDYQLLTDFINACSIMDIDEDIVAQTIALRKLHKIKTPDAIIASTALVWGFKLITRNINDFKKIDGLLLLNPHDIA